MCAQRLPAVYTKQQSRNNILFLLRRKITTRNVSEGSLLGTDPSLTRFEVALLKTGGVQRVENTGSYHNPTRQRGIFSNTAETQKRNPSLTRRVGIDTKAQLQNLRVGL